MPTYVFKNKETGEEWEEFMFMSERTKFLEENPHVEQIPNATAVFIDTVKLGRTKPAQGFRDLLKQHKKNNPRSTIPEY